MGRKPNHTSYESKPLSGTVVCIFPLFGPSQIHAELLKHLSYCSRDPEVLQGDVYLNVCSLFLYHTWNAVA